MLKKLRLTSASNDIGLAIVRVLLGIIIIPFGLEMFKPDIMAGYTQWLTDKGMPGADFMPYVGKVAELAGGVLLIPGLFTRLATISLMCTMAVINFFMLDGKINESPFFLLLLFACFFFVGGGRYSLDGLIDKKRGKD